MTRVDEEAIQKEMEALLSKMDPSIEANKLLAFIPLEETEKAFLNCGPIDLFEFDEDKFREAMSKVYDLRSLDNGS